MILFNYPLGLPGYKNIQMAVAAAFLSVGLITFNAISFSFVFLVVRDKNYFFLCCDYSI